MSLQLIGVGMHRTGTLSIKVALERLGISPCYHGFEYAGRSDHEAFWRRAVARDGDVDWSEIFDSYQAAFDWPTIAYWDKVVAAYPDAKVLLTDRDPDSWYESHAAALQTLIDGTGPQPTNPKLADITFNALLTAFDGNPLDRDRAIAVYTRHHAQVRHGVPADRLLVYKAEQGWPPLCRFLGVDVPAEPFPRVNTRDAFMPNLTLANARDHLDTEGIPWR